MIQDYVLARRLDALATRPLDAISRLWGCEGCGAVAEAACRGAGGPHAALGTEAGEGGTQNVSTPAGPHAARLEEAAAARAEWLALRCPDGRQAHRAWDRKVASSAPGSALYRAVAAASPELVDELVAMERTGQPAEGASDALTPAPAGAAAEDPKPKAGQLELFSGSELSGSFPNLSAFRKANAPIFPTNSEDFCGRPFLDGKVRQLADAKRGHT